MGAGGQAWLHLVKGNRRKHRRMCDRCFCHIKSRTSFLHTKVYYQTFGGYWLTWCLSFWSWLSSPLLGYSDREPKCNQWFDNQVIWWYHLIISDILSENVYKTFTRKSSKTDREGLSLTSEYHFSPTVFRFSVLPFLNLFCLPEFKLFLNCLLWIDKARAEDKTYVWLSVRWKTKN
jgi:hypothetical protein